MTRTLSALALAAVVALGAPAPSLGTMIRVPDDQPTIAAGMAAAASGDTVAVAAGTYFENVVLTSGVQLLGGWDAAFTFRDGAANLTVISGNNVGAAVTAVSSGAGTLVDGFRLQGGGGIPGAGVVIRGGAPVFSNNDISGNPQAGVAGGVYMEMGTTAVFRNNTVTRNSTQGSGGGFHIVNSSPSLLGNNISDNAALHGGGAVYAFNSAVYCSAGTMSRNIAGEGGGGAVHLQTSLTGTRFADLTIDNGTSPYGGGMLLRDAAQATLVRVTFQDCTASPYGAALRQLGGGLCLFGFTSATLTDCHFDNCDVVGGTSSLGGGIYVSRSSLTATGDDATSAFPSATIVDCDADGRGGGIYGGGMTGTLNRVKILDCTAVGFGGGAHFDSSTVTVTESVVESCAADDGGGLSFSDDRLTPNPSNVLNCTIYGCSAAASTGAGGIRHAGRANRNVAYIAGTLISHTTTGSCLKCIKTSGSGGASRPIVNCSTAYNDPSNTAATIGDTICLAAFNSDATNREGDPLFCAGSLALQDCSPDVASLTACLRAVPGRMDRGAAYTEMHCGCGLVSFEDLSWGRLKSHYR